LTYPEEWKKHQKKHPPPRPSPLFFNSHCITKTITCSFRLQFMIPHLLGTKNLTFKIYLAALLNEIFFPNCMYIYALNKPRFQINSMDVRAVN